VRFRAAGLVFEVLPDARVLDVERAALARLEAAGAEERPSVRIEIVAREPWSGEDQALRPRGTPAVLRCVDGRLFSSHASFTAEIDPFAGRALLHRREERSYPLLAVVRTAIVGCLPVAGGLPVHAAGIVADGRGLVFFGPSGAGKSTLAGTSEFPVLSDELVAVLPGRPFRLLPSGFWGEAASSSGPAAGAPLAALVEIARGPSFRLEKLAPSEGAVRLTGSLPVPFAPPLWARALPVLARLVAEVPVYRMEWSPSEPPLARLAALLGLSGPAA
jgi:hypothetical protein